MQETASKFLFDHNSQSNLKFEEPISFSPFNTRFSQNNFDLFINKFNQSNHDDNSFFNLKSMNSVKNFSNFSLEKNPKSKFEESVRTILTLKEPPTTISNKCTPTDNKSKNIILQVSESSKKKRGKKKAHDKEDYNEDEKHSRLLKHPISKLRKSKPSGARSDPLDIDANSIFLRLYPGDLTTKQLMLKLNNFPRLEIKTSKKTYLKKIVDHLREKWLLKLNNDKDNRFDVIIKPNPSLWLRDLAKISSNLNLPEEVAPLSETYMLSDIWSGYNEPESHKIDLFYEIKEIPIETDEIQTPKGRLTNGRKDMISRRPTGYFGGGQVIQTKEEPSGGIGLQTNKSNKEDNLVMPSEKLGPYSGADYFEDVRRSASLSRNSEKSSHEGKSNGSSGFSFNDTTANRESHSKGTHIAGSNDQSLKILYSQLNQQFPDESKFTSQLLKTGQNPNNSGPIKLIPVKRKI